MKFLTKIKNEIQNMQLAISVLFFKQKEFVENKIPYVSQFAHSEYAEKILKDGVEKTNDPNWKNTGAQSPEEYAEWVLIICGMACTSMALQHFKKQQIGIVTLAKDAKNHGVYKKEGQEISGMHYKEFVDWIENYGLSAKIYTRLGIRGLQKLLSNGDIVIVSVSPNIRGYKTADATQRGGHLVLVTGYDKKTNTITLHNPSGFASQNTQKDHCVLVSEFIKYYAGRGIDLNNKKSKN
ncbi:TPA: hypothetical protein DCZ46_00650 [Candidatus Campbellbacteria bacterium]|nr:MAG: hypothetical protein UR58_C0001G0115 [Candidatus Campbellbacteria bacterium GW2011_OD1_34_28]KKP75403.1 MAG: hypothetical protein UR74_C0001G0259 [Candidatus Campbellbacteria bacterium GW2011_GWD2_35_24]KKP76036.1 MAG: hypothetical protein UR75_C0001G0070 [Candidatus Campbellbacteria bacterium GW2011_GWC2_35_28]KKP77225.1 MAG: hypothetical protein UR76_C0001G0070 [Candidatus Campbellbacteria bacterium GW2011_GWC1_35_31]KKP79154.1 MAG: hypothetical protein UR79_C0001G0070 [Candidatus Cam